jgi:hypothetical protein
LAESVFIESFKFQTLICPPLKRNANALKFELRTIISRGAAVGDVEALPEARDFPSSLKART